MMAGYTTDPPITREDIDAIAARIREDCGDCTVEVVGQSMTALWRRLAPGTDLTGYSVTFEASMSAGSVLIRPVFPPLPPPPSRPFPANVRRADPCAPLFPFAVLGALGMAALLVLIVWRALS